MISAGALLDYLESISKMSMAGISDDAVCGSHGLLKQKLVMGTSPWVTKILKL